MRTYRFFTIDHEFTHIAEIFLFYRNPCNLKNPIPQRNNRFL